MKKFLLLLMVAPLVILVSGCTANPTADFSASGSCLGLGSSLSLTNGTPSCIISLTTTKTDNTGKSADFEIVFHPSSSVYVKLYDDNNNEITRFQTATLTSQGAKDVRNFKVIAFKNEGAGTTTYSLDATLVWNSTEEQKTITFPISVS